MKDLLEAILAQGYGLQDSSKRVVMTAPDSAHTQPIRNGSLIRFVCSVMLRPYVNREEIMFCTSKSRITAPHHVYIIRYSAIQQYHNFVIMRHDKDTLQISMMCTVYVKIHSPDVPIDRKIRDWSVSFPKQIFERVP